MASVTDHPVAVDTDPAAVRPFLRRIVLDQYKSIAHCDVELGRLTVIVGRNAAGKSNFLDALRFVADSLDSSLDQAIRSRGGIDQVRRRSTGHPHNVRIRLEFGLTGSRSATYMFQIKALTKGAFAVKHEELVVLSESGGTEIGYTVQEGVVEAVGQSAPMPKAAPARLYLPTVAGFEGFDEVHAALRSMMIYNFVPDAMRELQSPDAGELLRRGGENIAGVVERLATDRPDLLARIVEYLRTVVPGVASVARIAVGPKETVEFQQWVDQNEDPWKFYASSMSDGTLRALGILVAVFQLADRKAPVRLVGIEEPEAALHPAALGAVVSALREASHHTQILITSHGTDLLDHVDPFVDRVLVASNRTGDTVIGHIDNASLESIRENLFTAGELLGMDQLEPALTRSDRESLAGAEPIPPHMGDAVP